MKTQTLSLIAGAVLLLCLGRSPVAAQGVAKVQIPFDFQVRDLRFPAGDYVVRRDPVRPQLLVMRSSDGKHAMAVLTMPHSLPEAPAQASLVFQGYGDQRFLKEVRLVGYGDGFALFKSKTERKQAQLAEVK